MFGSYRHIKVYLLLGFRSGIKHPPFISSDHGIFMLYQIVIKGEFLFKMVRNVF